MQFMSSDVIDSLDKKRLTEDDTSDSDFSYDSEASDGTYVPSCEEDTFETACSHQPSQVSSPEVLLPILPLIKKEEMPERSASRASQKRATTPVPIQSPYNLRSRSSRPTPNSSIVNESPEVFGKLVKQQERISRRNMSFVKETSIKESPRKSVPSYYSSDDE